MSRGAGPTRHTEIPRGSGLARHAPLPRGDHQLDRSTPPRPTTRAPRADGRGDPIPRDLAAYIIERADDGHCDWCGRYCLGGHYSRQHRVARGMGGRAGAHTAANLVLLCGSATSPGGCHLRCERDDLDAARAAGFRLRDHEDPADTPIHRHGTHWVLPTATGWIPVVYIDGSWRRVASADRHTGTG